MKNKIQDLERSPTLIDFLRWILNRDPHQRPTVSEVSRRFRRISGTIAHEVRHGPTRNDQSAEDDDDNGTVPRPINTRNSADLMGSGRLKQAYMDENAHDPTTFGRSLFLYDTMIASQRCPTPLSHEIILHKNPVLHFPSSHVLSTCHRDKSFYRLAITRVTSAVYLGSLAAVVDTDQMFKMGITHVINCCDGLSLHFDGIESMDIKGDRVIAKEMSGILSFLQRAIVRGGRALVVDEGGNSRACLLLTCWLVQRYDVSIYDAMLYLRRRRPVMRLSTSTIMMINGWTSRGRINSDGGNRSRIGVVLVKHQCLCGLVVVTLQDNYANNGDDTSLEVCSTSLEGKLLQAYDRAYGICLDELRWRFVSASDIVEKGWDRCTTDFDAAKAFPDLEYHNLPSADWQLRRCRACGYITHATRASKEGGDDIAVVTSFEIDRSGCCRNYTASSSLNAILL